jgi:hypothetical protein
MQRLLFTTIAYAAVIASVHGQDPTDSVKAGEPGPELANLKEIRRLKQLAVKHVRVRARHPNLIIPKRREAR